MGDDVFRANLGRPVVIVTDSTGHEVNLSTFGTLQDGDIKDISREVGPIQPRPASYRISLTFEQAPHGVAGLRQMAPPLTVECTGFYGGSVAQDYTLTGAWLDSIDNRTVIFLAEEMAD